MKHFSFYLPTRVESSSGLLSRAGELAKSVVPGRRALLVTDRGVRRAGIADTVAKALEKEGFECAWFDNVQPNPKDRDCEEGGRAAREFRTDLVVAVGGGSVIDSAKAIALLGTHGGKARDYEGRGRVPSGIIPVAAIPTTAGTGSEVTRSAVITDTERKFKMTLKDVWLAPRLALVDPETTFALSPSITATTGMDALVHALEAYTCRVANPFSDIFALWAMEEIFPWLREAVSDGSNREARSRLMNGSLLAGIAFSHADVAAVHCLAEALGGLYDIPHGDANSMFLPVVTAFNAEADPKRHAKAAAACGLDVSGLDDRDAASLLVTELRSLARDIGIPSFRRFSAVNPVDFPLLAEAARQNGSTPSNCRTIGQDDYLRLLEQCYNE